VTRRARRHAAGVVVKPALGAIIGVHHSELAAGDITTTAWARSSSCASGLHRGATVAAIAIALPLGSWNAPRHLLPAGVHIVLPRATPEPRAGPPWHARLCVWRP
jgi:hypothetical protein